MQQQWSRREFARVLALSSAGFAFSACMPQILVPTTPSLHVTGSPTATPTKAPTQKSLPPGQALQKIDFLAGEMLGRATNITVSVNVVPAKNMEIYYEYGTTAGIYSSQTKLQTAVANIPLASLIDNLTPNTRCYYRLRYCHPGSAEFSAGPEHTFVTQRSPGSTFTFDIIGDSHPERLGKQFDPELYRRTLENASSDQPDFLLTIGDDFSVDALKTIDASTVTGRYTLQRPFLGIVGHSASIFLVNGNHEQAALCNLDGTPNNVAVWAQRARNEYYPQPAPDGFYTGDAQVVEYLGLLRDYYAWTWGDALFVVIDPYWHSPVPVDNVLGGGNKRNDMWAITLGEAQYQWFKRTLEESRAKYKFVFTHHVLGTGRGGIELAEEFEWGGKGKNGVWEFDRRRPGWPLPIHPLMVQNGVTILFQGHDHIFVKQEMDNVTYQTLPEPANPFYGWENADAYKSGDKLPNSGHVRVTVSPGRALVDYVRSYLPKDESAGKKSGDVTYSYAVEPRTQ